VNFRDEANPATLADSQLPHQAENVKRTKTWLKWRTWQNRSCT